MSSGNGHSLAVDSWQLGIFIYELINGSTPFSSDNIQDGGEKGMYDRIIAHKGGSLTVPGVDVSKECLAFINKLVVPDENKRIKSNKLTKDSWFSNFDFNQLKQGTMAAPFANVVQRQMEKVYAGKASGESKSSGRSKVTSVPYLGDSDWFDLF